MGVDLSVRLYVDQKVMTWDYRLPDELVRDAFAHWTVEEKAKRGDVASLVALSDASRSREILRDAVAGLMAASIMSMAEKLHEVEMTRQKFRTRLPSHKDGYGK